MLISELVNKIGEKGIELECMFGRRYMWEVSMRSKKKPAYVKIAITDEMAEKLLRHDDIPLFLLLPFDITDTILKEDAKARGESHG